MDPFTRRAMRTETFAIQEHFRLHLAGCPGPKGGGALGAIRPPKSALHYPGWVFFWRVPFLGVQDLGRKQFGGTSLAWACLHCEIQTRKSGCQTRKKKEMCPRKCGLREVARKTAEIPPRKRSQSISTVVKHGNEEPIPISHTHPSETCPRKCFLRPPDFFNSISISKLGFA